MLAFGDAVDPMDLGQAMIVAGVGCRKGASAEDIGAVIGDALARAGFSATALDLIAAPELKRGERGIVVAAAALGVPLRDPLEREVVALRAAGGEDHFLGRHTVIGSDLVARLVDRLARPLSQSVHAGGVAVLIGEVRHHRLEHLGIEWRGGGMVEVHHRHHSIARLRVGI